MKNVKIYDVPEYKKRKPSTVSKIAARTNHKHKYIECKLISVLNNREYIYGAECCEICGKIRQVKFFDGHTHNSPESILEKNISEYLNSNGYPCSIHNVGCMHWNYEPVTLDEILKG